MLLHSSCCKTLIAGAIVNSFCGAFSTKPSKAIFRTQSYIQDGAFAKIVSGFRWLTCVQHGSILDVWLGSKYSSTHYPRKSAKMQLLSKLSKALHNFFSLLFFQTSYFKVAFKQSYSKLFPNFQDLQKRSFLGNIQNLGQCYF